MIKIFRELGMFGDSGSKLIAVDRCALKIINQSLCNVAANLV